MSRVHLRVAGPPDAPELSELAFRSKGYWGYDPAFLESCRDELRVDPGRCDGTHVVVAEHDGSLVGFFDFGGQPPAGKLNKLFVDPEAIGSGVGSVLLTAVRHTATEAGFARLAIVSEPHAETFYTRVGAYRVGSSPSGSIAGRQLPLLCWDLLSPQT